MSLIEWLSHIDATMWLGLGSFVLALVGIPLAWLLARRVRRIPQLRFVVDFDVLVGPDDGLLNRGLAMTFRDEPVARVARTYIAFWNQGGDTVNHEDILPHDPLRVALTPGDLPLQTRMTYRSRPQIEMNSELVDDQVVLDFLFLDPGDGGILEVLHQGQAPPSVEGTVKGATLRQISRRVSLTAASVEWMSGRHWRDRFVGRVKSRFNNPLLRRLAVPLVAAVVMTLVLDGLVGWIFLTDYGHAPVVVNAQKYNLKTVDGQRDFSHAVNHQGAPQQSEALLLGLPALAANTMAAIMLTLTLLGQRFIPRSIVIEKVPPGADGNLQR